MPNDETIEDQSNPTGADPTGAEPTEQADRTAQPVDAEAPPRLAFPVVGVGASAGGLEAFLEFIAAMRADSGMAIVFIQHLPPDRESLMAEILANKTPIPVAQVEDGMAIERDHLYVIRPGHVLTMEGGAFRLGPQLGRGAANRPVDDFFRSLAQEQRERAIAVLLSGMGSNGSAGAQMIKAVGGLCVAQDPETALFPSMPRAVIDQGYADYILRPADMPEVLLRYAGHPYARAGRRHTADALRRHQPELRDVLSILRVRSRQDFSGYKKPTILRRVQRRMGLTQTTEMGDYARLLRQSPTEVQALADDLLIHVTGFFRDPPAWDALREKVIVPLVANREPEGEVRGWVTACSSGEEAYTLAMVLFEEAERANKPLAIKVFATDMAERALGHARAGVYPGGIESEIDAQRLERFFEREDGVYRVRPFLRECVVFAPQNVLQDPPFSRLDIATCRNLLIYLEPELQQRVLALLHFGLREGGALFLGSSETVGGSDGMFEPIDKAARIFRRVGPTRHGMADFPIAQALRGPAGTIPAGAVGPAAPPDPRTPTERRAGPTRPSLAALTQRTLIEHHTPAAVAVDRDHRVLYYHGNTRPFLEHPPGEPTRDLLALARPGLRGAVRTALNRAGAENRAATVLDGWVETADGGRARTAVTASPVAANDFASDYLVVSFEQREEIGPVVVGGGIGGDGDGDGDADGAAGGVIAEELRRVRDELQSTIEELQTTNEELKASHEEVTSMNEELQSSNEELETSKEEMQSLNEELTTVNAQLQAKMEEHQEARNDLTALLASTDIAVLFLDAAFRIRRYTPAVRDLVDLIPGDVGRPLAALNRKFDDPHLDADVRAVLEKLVPAERQVAGANGRHYARRALPYRTVDNRIDGVVVTFVDVTDRKRVEGEVAEARHYAESIVETLHEPLLVLNPDLTVKTANDAFYRHFRVKAGETVGRKIYQLGNGQWDIPALRTALEEVLPTDKAFDDYEVAHEFRDLGRRVMLLNGRRLDHVQLILLGIRDVTDRRAAEAALRDREARFRTLVQNLRDYAILMTDPDGVVTEWTEGAERVTGYAAAEAVGQHVSLIYTPEQVADGYVQREFGEAAEAGRAEREDWRQRKGGERFWCNEIVTAVRDDAGRVTAFAKISRDLTTRQRAEAAMREGDDRFRLVFEGVRDVAMIMHDVDGRVTAWNAGAERILGFTKEEAVGRMGNFIFIPEDQAANAPEKERAQARANGSAPDERWHVRKNGVRFWASGVMTALKNPDGSPRGFVKVLRDETARKAAEDALNAAKATAELANRMKDEFLATLSHELRTPLSSILIWSKLLRRQAAAQPEVAEGMDAIMRSAEAQKQLIEDLLDTSRITSGKLRLELRFTDLAPLVKQSVGAILPTAEAKGITVASDIGEDVGVVWADPDRLRQVIWNLLSNAVKFTPAGGRVDVGVWRRGRAVEIRVADTGKGIDPAFLPHVFEPFRQAESSTTRAYGGLGLGLAICRQLVEQHGGTIDAASGGAGKGSVFIVRLPLPAMRTAATHRAAARAAGGTLPGQPGEAAAGELGGARVLLVEDEPETRTAIAMLLRNAGADVTAVESAAAAADAFRASRPDVLISDIGMPDEDGYSLIGRIRAMEAAGTGGKPGTPPVPAVALTAFARDDDRRRALAAGFQHYLSKPVDPEDLLALLRRLVPAGGAGGS